MDQYNDRKLILLEELENQQHLEDLKNSRGWKVIYRHFNTVLKAITEKILVCKKEDLLQLQERYRAFNSMLELVEDNTNFTLRIRDELQILIDEENFNKEYAVNA